MVYLRARQYAPGMGRFLTRDTWGGDANSPMSYNKWQYVYSNPVNITDPTGYSPIWCQSMPNKATYAVCALTYYRLQPINIFNLAESVKGEKGCYTGPTEYRAPGYIEGHGWNFTSIWFLGFHEMVYDFATMERTDFNAEGYGVHDMSVGLSYSQYAAIVYGLKTTSDVITDYQGPFLVGSFGGGVGTAGGLEVGLGVGIGRSLFVSTQDLTINGKSWYLSASFGVDGMPIFDAGLGYLDYTPDSMVIEHYADKHSVYRKAELINDIMSSEHDVWVVPSGPLETVVKINGVIMAQWYSKAYDELHDTNQ